MSCMPLCRNVELFCESFSGYLKHLRESHPITLKSTTSIHLKKKTLIKYWLKYRLKNNNDYGTQCSLSTK